MRVCFCVVVKKTHVYVYMCFYIGIFLLQVPFGFWHLKHKG